MARASWLSWLPLAALAGCLAPGYSPYPLDLDQDLPADAFARCRDVLLRRFDVLTRSDPSAFQLQTGWAPSPDPPGERRASVYRDPGRGRSLAVVVELRRLSTPILGWPRWTEPRGDAASERVLAAALREALQDPERIGFTP